MTPPMALSLAPTPVTWAEDTWWPAKPTTPTAAGTSTDFSTALAAKPAQDAPSGNSYTQSGGSVSNVGTTELLLTVASVWACQFSTVGAVTPTRSRLRRFNKWAPELSNTLAPPLDDGWNRLAWLRCWLYTGDTVAGAGDDNVGLSLVPDDGAAFTVAAYGPKSAGGFGIFKKTATSDYRFASYSAAGALLEAIDLATGAGWHVADFLIRQAKLNDAGTPWLTVRWDGVDVITQRAFGHANLPTPQSMKTFAHGWAFLCLINAEESALPWASRFRMGAFYPDGSPVQP